jgi:hypothetical protein
VVSVSDRERRIDPLALSRVEGRAHRKALPPFRPRMRMQSKDQVDQPSGTPKDACFAQRRVHAPPHPIRFGDPSMCHTDARRLGLAPSFWFRHGAFRFNISLDDAHQADVPVHTLGASFRCQLRSKTSGTFTASRPSAGQRRKKLRTRTCRESGFRVIALSSSRAGESNNATTAFPRVELRWVNEDQILNLFAASQRRADSAVPVVL